MKDRYRTLLRRSFKDAYYVAEDVEEEHGIRVPDEAYSSMAMGLYRHRVQAYRRRLMKAEQESQYPDTDPSIGRQ